MKSVKGLVGVEEKAGRYRLRLPRSIAEGSSRYISTGLTASRENYARVLQVACTIEDDIKHECFDTSLERYTFKKPQAVKIKRLVNLSLLEVWNLYSEYKKPQVAITTYLNSYASRYAHHLERLPSHQLEDSLLIRDHLIKTLSPYTAQQMLQQLNAACSWALDSGVITQNPFLGMAQEIKLKSGGDIDPFTSKERDAILQAYEAHPLYKHYHPFVCFLFLTGCRTGEAVGLKWKNVSNDLKHITFAETYNSKYHLYKETKTGKTRRFPCNATLQELLSSIPRGDREEHLFKSKTGKTMTNDKFFDRGGWKRIIDELVFVGKVERYRVPYTTRHTFITLALEAGLTVPQVAKLVGNSPQVILKHYAGSSIDEIPVF